MGSLPIDDVEYGVNYACFTQNGKHYICSCQKRSIENRLRLYDEYFCKFGYYDILTGITYSAGDPEMKRRVLGFPSLIDKYIDYSRDIIEQINFKPYICHECNNAVAAFFSPLHPKSKKWRNMPYKINSCIALGIYPCKSLPPRKGRYYFFLDDALSFRVIHDSTFSGALLNNFQYRSMTVNFDWYESLNKRFSKNEQRKLLCTPGYFDNETEKEVYGYLFDSRRSIKSKLNSLIATLLSKGISVVEDCKFDDSEERQRIYDYTLKDGKIIMDKILEPFFRTEHEIYLKYAKAPSVLGFCFRIRAYNRFYEAIENVPVERIVDEVEFVPNVITDVERLKFYSQSNYFKFLAHGMQIAEYITEVLLFSDRYNDNEVLDVLFAITEEFGLQNKLVPIIQSFYKKDMNLSYYNVKRDYAELLLRILSFNPRLYLNSTKTFVDCFSDTFSKELKEGNVELTSDDFFTIFHYVNKFLNNFTDSKIPLRSIRNM